MTRLEALTALTAPYAEQAISYTYPDSLHDIVDNISSALSSSFVWDDTTEGFDYWEEKHIALKNLGL